MLGAQKVPYQLTPINTQYLAGAAGVLGNQVHQLEVGANPNSTILGAGTPLYNMLQSVGQRPLGDEYRWLGYFAIMHENDVVGACGLFAHNDTYTTSPKFQNGYAHTGWVFIDPAHQGQGLATQAVAYMMRFAHQMGFPSFFTLMDCPARTEPQGRGVYVQRLGMTELSDQKMDELDTVFREKMYQLYESQPDDPNRLLDLYWLAIDDLAAHQEQLDQIIDPAKLKCDEGAALAFLQSQQNRNWV